MTVDSPVRRSLWVTAAFLLCVLALKALERHGLLGADAVMRLTGMAMGALVIANANSIPKRLVPLERLGCDPARDQALRRFGAWSLVLGGLAYLLAYALAPMAIASTLAICLLAPAAVAVAFLVGRCAWKRRNAA